MELNEVNKLYLEVSSKCSLKEKEIEDVFINVPKPDEYDSEAEGYKLCIKKTAITNESALNCIKSIVQKRKLRMMKLKEYWVIYTPRKV